MNVGFVFQKDSHLRAVQATALRLGRQYDIEAQFYALNSDLDDVGLSKINATILNLDQLNRMEVCDYLICCLGGYLLNRVINHFKNTDIKIVSLFPGIVSHYQLDAFISRFNADQVWLNCPADYELYKKLCQIFHVKDNGVLYGASWFFDDKSLKSQHKKNNDCTTMIFFEQTEVISSQIMAKKIEEQLTDVILSAPNKSFIYKMRYNFHNEYLVEIRQNLAKFHNVTMRDELTEDDICAADAYLSISSSAIIEGLLLNKRCYLLSEAYLDKDSWEIFKGSGIFYDKPNIKLNKEWSYQRILFPRELYVLPASDKQTINNFSKRNLNEMIKWVIKLTWHFPKMWQLIFNKNKLKAMQKSLEYVSYDK